MGRTKTNYTHTTVSENELHSNHLFFNKQLGHAIYRTIVLGTPYDTGSAVHSIKIRLNTEMKKKFTFVGNEASHVQHLEEGTSNHGKHKHFIRNGIIPSVIGDIINYYETRGGSVSNLEHSRRAFLSSVAKSKGFGKGKVTVGRSRHFKNDNRQLRKQRSLSRQKP